MIGTRMQRLKDESILKGIGVMAGSEVVKGGFVCYVAIDANPHQPIRILRNDEWVNQGLEIGLPERAEVDATLDFKIIE
jgi:hypothetical protein